jgi:CubicO group peptidase (beta-lactamase class C family)
MGAFDQRRLQRLRDVIDRHVERGDVAGVAWLAARDDEIEVGVAGTLTRGEARPVARDSIFRIASMTKPIVAVATLRVVEDCRLRLDDPVDDLLPELADRRVLVDAGGPIDGATVAAIRPITLGDVITFRLGLGMDLYGPWPQPLMEAMDELRLGVGPPTPRVPPAPDEWMRRLSTLPLLHQPGDRWLYDTGSDVLGVLIARASGRPLDVLLRDTVFEPLAMVDSGFYATDTSRLSVCYARDPETGAVVVHDPVDGQWSEAPGFPAGGGGLVSTVDDFHAFARMLLDGGRLPDGERLLSRASVQAMTTDHIGARPGVPGPAPDGSLGWGFGVAVRVRRTGVAHNPGTYGWDGGLGTSWVNDPVERLVGIVLTTDSFTAPFPQPAVIRDFWTCVYAALND